MASIEADQLNAHIQVLKEEGMLNVGEICDGYHTFNELYEHRIMLFIALCRVMNNYGVYVWRSKKHSDTSEWEGWFILGIRANRGEQITYHLPDDKWEFTDFADTRIMAPKWDGHTSEDVLERLKKLYV